MAGRICSVDGCEKPYVARGWCGMHYARWRKYGTVEDRNLCKSGLHGRTPENVLSDGRCGPCRDAWVRANADKVRAKAKRYYERNIQQERQRALRWYYENHERALENGRRWGQENPDKRRAKTQRWAAANPDRLRELQRKRKRRRDFGADDPETLDYVEILTNDPCCFCGEPATSIEHIVPVVAGGPDHWSNYSAACHSCNSRKHAMSLLTFLRRRAA